jgi:hypothetical protein
MKLYTPVQVTIADSQREKFKTQINQKYVPVKIVVKGTGTPKDTLLLTRGQIRKIEKAQELGKRRYKTIRMSRNQIDKNRKYQGGYLQLLNDVSMNDSTNSSMDNVDNGLYLVKRGHTMQIISIQEDGLHLQEHPLSLHETFPDGVYQKHGNVIENVDTVLLDEKKLPILQWIL